jgi:1-deoxy-D-xylulose-5-phosphate synthase
MILEKIKKPNDIHKVSLEDFPRLAEEIRSFLIQSVSETGGHLASNLGVVELTLALHNVLDLPQDKLIWDVGHQAYTHKILTGRKDGFKDLRKEGGLSGFPKRNESDCDSFDTGHSSNSISAGLGYVRARDLMGEKYHVVSVIGDGALTGGMAYEALNNAAELKTNFIIIINDNNMSISKNVGGMSTYLSALRTAETYTGMKIGVTKTLKKIPHVGTAVVDTVRKTKSSIKQLIIPGMLFENMGLTYLGPVDGHNMRQMMKLFNEAKRVEGPVVVHVLTEKGRGYGPASSHPERFHGTGPFDIQSGRPLAAKTAPTYTDHFSGAICSLAEKNKKVVAITAAMPDGTGLNRFRKKFPERFFDVGMAEQHAVTFAAGLASQGMLPVVCIYSTFLQRSYDQIIHDVNLLRENVVFAIDRAGFVPADGETHQGIYDPAFLSQLGMPLYAPSNYQELNYWLQQLLSDRFHGPRAIRYPRGGQDAALAEFGCTGEDYDFLRKADDATIVLVSYADELADLLQAERELQQKSIACDVIKAVKLYPFTGKMIADLSKYKIILFAEECIANGSIGEHLEYALQQNGWNGRFIHCAVRNACLPHASVAQIKQATGLDAAHLVQAVQMVVTKGENLL